MADLAHPEIARAGTARPRRASARLLAAAAPGCASDDNTPASIG